MSITRARWSDTEKKAVLDCYGTAKDADDFFELLKNALETTFTRRTVKAYLTFLNDNLLPKTDPRRPVYQSLCDANQKEIAQERTHQMRLEDLTRVKDISIANFKAVTDDDSWAAAKSQWATNIRAYMEILPNVPANHRSELGAAINQAVGEVQAACDAAKPTPAPTVTPAQDYNWVEKEVDVVPRVPPGRVAPPSLFRDPSLPTLTEALAAKAAEHAAQPRPVVTPDPKALVPRHYPALPPKAKFTADELAQVFGLHRTKVVDAFAYGFIQTLDGAHITYQTAQRIHDAMSEGHSFSEACRQVNPNSTGLLPMEALIETPDEQAPVTVPGTEAGKVTLKVEDWTVNGGPMNPKSVAKMAADINTSTGMFVAPVEVLKGPPALFQGGEVFPAVKSVEVPSEPAKTVEPTPAATPTPEVAPEVQSGPFERYTLEAVRDGVLTTAQAVDILHPRDTNKAVWALSLLASGKITVVQCDRLLYAKSL